MQIIGAFLCVEAKIVEVSIFYPSDLDVCNTVGGELDAFLICPRAINRYAIEV